MRAKIVTDIPSWSASSEGDSRQSADRADIKTLETAYLAGAWSAATNDYDQWLMANLGIVTLIFGIATKGRNYSPDWPLGHHDQYVIAYFISYGNQNGDENFYTDAAGDLIVFHGNYDRDTEVYHDFRDYNGPIIARYIKIYPALWNEWISMRAKIVTDLPSWSASSEGDSRQSADRADIKTLETASLAGAWSAATNDYDQWLMANLGIVTLIFGIATKGRNYSPDWPLGYNYHDQYVIAYFISYGNQTFNENFYTDAAGDLIVFQGNYDRDTEVYHDFRDYNGPITARYIKIHPVSWNEWISMRAKIVTGTADIVLTLDLSSSIQFNGFSVARKFMMDFSGCPALTDNGAQVAVGVVLYTCTPRTYVTLGQHAVGSKVLRDRINYISYSGGQGRTENAIRYIRVTSAFRTRSKRAAVILTDGNTEDPAGMAAEAAAALDARINLYGVGVGTLVNQAGLEDITGDPQRIFTVSSEPCIAAQKIMDDLNA
ncbi:lactadherin-like [Branchiostoma floridae x Branchiostoma belcheri]